ncbi:prolyl oligopeptidase family serine peptidase [Corallibacter sp.]|uniref:S9 family peptidase n=1 Tax=Corallibacter sp. TaxID=2038084 RepID=UPI003A92FC54
MKNHFFLTLISLFTAVAVSQNTNTSTLQIETIMKGNDFIGHLPSNPEWYDNNNVYFDWNPDNAFSDSLYVYNLKTDKVSKVDFETEYNLPASYAVFNASRTKKVYSKYGDIYITDVKTNSTTRITQTLERESNPHFTLNDTQIAYVKNGNLFTWTLKTGETKQVTNFKKVKAEVKDTEKDAWLKEDQLAMFTVLQERKAKADMRDSLLKRYEVKKPLEIDTKGRAIRNQQMSPDGNYVTYLTVKYAKNKRTIMPHYVTESGYTEDENTRSKVGDEQSVYEMHIYDVKNRKTYPVVLDNLEGLDYIPEYTKDYPNKTYVNENRIEYISNPYWNTTGSKAIINITSNDYKDRWIALLNLDNGTIKNVDHQHDEAWIAGPGIGWFSNLSLGWMPDNENIWFMSEKSGYAHLYTTNVRTLKTKALTSGKFEIYNPKISNDKTRWYFTANKNHPGDRQFYTMPIKGGKHEQLTENVGRNDVVLSPDEKQMAILYSFSNKPTELYVKQNPVYAKGETILKQVTHSTTKTFNTYAWRAPEVITFKADDGAQVHARLYQPKSSVKNNAAVIFVHGAGYLQNAHKWWSSYYREYMFHNLLVDNGYTVLDIDYRASAGYGRDWRTGIYRHMGGKDLSDQVDGAEYLISNLGIDKNKVGIYGGSYGGFITLMGMFNAADTFKAGAAIRSVGDWAAYNHGYTARILNTPVTDSIAYKRSSPIYFADGLKGDLLILHGMIDDNVHFQDMVRLSQRLIELGKENWEMAIYPVERHGFVEPSSWTDEYTRIFKLFQKSLLGIE